MLWVAAALLLVYVMQDMKDILVWIAILVLRVVTRVALATMGAPIAPI